MRIGVVSDIHCNIAALEHALGLMGPIDQLFALGDVIDEFRFSAPVVGLLRARGALTIRGNHEQVFFDGPGAEARLGAVEDAALANWLATRPSEAELELLGQRMLLVHATPWPSNYDYVPPGSSAFSRFAEVDADIVLYGHTHQPVVRKVGSTLVINPGSTGIGRPHDEGFVQSCAVLDVATGAARIIDFRT
ncbi:MAG: metallophosphoesterase family protein [Hyphomonadaceae bacterium]|nr:metallophosphoesterase family protein [Hyphomonadaceae bacterium]